MAATVHRARISPRAKALALALFAIAAIGFAAPGWSQAQLPVAAPAPAAGEAPPPQVQTLLNLLADPAVRAWIERQRPAASANGPATASAPAVAGGTAPAADAGVPAQESTSSIAARRMQMVREHLAGLAMAVPRLPGEVEEAVNVLMLEFNQRQRIRLLLQLIGFVALGVGTEWLFRRLSRGALRWLLALRLDTVSDRLRAVMARFGYGLAMVAMFAVGSVGAFLALDWEPLVREILLGYLLAFLALRLALVAMRFLLAPGSERFRIIPMPTPAAWFWHNRIVLAVGWFAFARVTLEIFDILGVSHDVLRLMAYLAGLGLLAIGLDMVWRRPIVEQAESAAPGGGRIGRTAGNVLVTIFFVLLWLLWVGTSIYLFWGGIVAVGLPAAIRLTRRAVNHILRPPGAAVEEAGVPNLFAALLERGLRVALIIGAALLLAHVWGLQFGDLAMRDTMLTRLVRGSLMAVVILLVADFAWHVLKTLIDRKLLDAQSPGPPDSDEAHRKARLRTLLPILRNMLLIVMLVLAALMALSALGVEIGPLVAGAGVVGVAIGFGAQTLVRDIISGIFFLTDDAFRVGEYIQSGNFKGTVESFSLRSVKLRHHRGPLYTVPFGALGAIQNMSRDWVIDKLSIGVTYDSDLELARKLIKQVGKELLADPELAVNIIEPLKMQGVEQFGDYAIQLRMKMMTKPGEQFVIRRRALSLIKKAFDANGIKFAFPTVQVAGGGDMAGAVARQGLELVHPPAGASGGS